MIKKTGYLLPAMCGILMVVYGCGQQQHEVATKPNGSQPEHTFTINGSIREMVIWPETPEFPEHEGKAEFVSYCGICHSLKYISMQPDFPRKTWEAEINKMVTKFKAPVDSVTGKKIIDYIVAIKSNH